MNCDTSITRCERKNSGYRNNLIIDGNETIQYIGLTVRELGMKIILLLVYLKYKLRHLLSKKSLLLMVMLFYISGIHIAKPDFSCPNVGRPIKKIEANTYYNRSDPTRSTIIEDLYEKNARLLNNIDNFQTQIVRLGDESDSKAISCMLDILIEWANNKSFEVSSSSGQPEKVRLWLLSSISLSYLKNYDRFSEKDNAIIAEWLRSLGNISMNYIKSRRKMTNIGYWGVLAVGAAAVAANDAEMWRYAEGKFREALADIRPNGTLSAELGRGSKALKYHVFAAQPLVAFNFIRSYVECDTKFPKELDSLIVMIKHDIEGRRYIDRLTGITQMPSSRPSWLYLADNDNYADNNMTPSVVRLGGRLDRLRVALKKKFRSCGL